MRRGAHLTKPTSWVGNMRRGAHLTKPTSWVASATKFSTVFGTVFPKRPISIRPRAFPPDSISKKTCSNTEYTICTAVLRVGCEPHKERVLGGTSQHLRELFRVMETLLFHGLTHHVRNQWPFLCPSEGEQDQKPQQRHPQRRTKLHFRPATLTQRKGTHAACTWYR